MRPISSLPLAAAALLLLVGQSLPAAAQDRPPISWQDWSPPRDAPERRTGQGWTDPADAGLPALQCSGTEPFWGLDLTEGEATLSSPERRDRSLVPGTPERVANRTDRWVVPLSRDRWAETTGYAVITEGRCSDGMSDRDYEYDVTLIGALERPTAGCCRTMEVALAPTVDVSPRRAAPGETVTVTAGGFPANTDVMIAAGPPRSEYTPLLPARTDRRGQVRAEVPMPRAAAGYDDYIFAVRSGATGLDATSSPVEVADRGSEGGMTVTGTLTREGVECPALRGDDGRLYTLAGFNLGRYQPGDRVRVTGGTAEMSFCQQGTTIAVDSVERARR